MALSVSAFPEHIQVRHNDVLSSTSTGDDGNHRNLVTTPRILGFFGAVGSVASNRKPESHSQATRVEELEGLSLPTPTTFLLSPPRQYEERIELEGQGGPSWVQNSSRLHQPSPFAHRTTPPIRLGASSATRALPFPTPVPSKSLAQPTQQRSSTEASSSSAAHVPQPISSSRPLPILPPMESFKPTPPSLPSIPGSLKPGSIIPPSRSATSTPGSSKHNALPTPPLRSNSIPVPPRQSPSTSRMPLQPTTTPSVTPPSSKVLITQPQRGHQANSTSVSMRYQPLFVDLPSPDTSPPASASTSDSAIFTTSVRPLPRVPPSLSSVINFGLPSSAVISKTSSSIIPASPKRPRTSPGSFTGVSGLGSSSSSSAIPSSWASKPSSSRLNSPPSSSAALQTPRRPPALKLPRARSCLRTRREKSLDSYSRLSSRSPPGSPGLISSFTVSAGVNGSLTVGRYNQGLTGGRPLTKRSNMTPAIMGRHHERRHSLLSISRFEEDSALGKVSIPPSSSFARSHTLRHVRPQCPPSGPVMRTKSGKLTSPTPPGQFNAPAPKPASQTALDSIGDTLHADPSEKLHVHPILTSLGKDECGASTKSLDSPLEFFVDGPETDVASINRSPSPIRYALPHSNDDSSDWHSTDGETTDDDLGGVSSSTSASRGWAAGRRRAQLRSYRMDYRPQGHLAHESGSFEYGSPSPEIEEATILPKPIRALPVPPKASSKKKAKEKWSLSDFTSPSSPSAPGTRASSPERKGRSMQPRFLAEAVSLALGSRHVIASHSRSGRGSVSGPSQLPDLSSSRSHTRSGGGGGSVATEYEVLDISVPSTGELREDRKSPSVLDFRIQKSSSTIRADPNNRPDAQMYARRASVTQGSSGSGAVGGRRASEASQSEVLWVTKEGKQSGVRDATPAESRIVFRSPSDEAEDDMPFMSLLSRVRPLPSFVPLPPQGSLRNRPPLTSPNREAFPMMVPRTAGALPYPPKEIDEAGRKQRTTSGPSRFGRMGSISNISTVEPARQALNGGGAVDEDDDDDIYCEEQEPKLDLKVINSRRVVGRGGLWGEDGRETQVVDVIPKLRSLKTSR